MHWRARRRHPGNLRPRTALDEQRVRLGCERPAGRALRRARNAPAQLDGGAGGQRHLRQPGPFHEPEPEVQGAYGMKTQSPDTSIEAEQVLIDIARRMPVWRKLQLAEQWGAALRRAMKAEI